MPSSKPNQSKPKRKSSGQDRKLTTNELAEILGCKPDTIRRSLCIKGHYLGLKPVKLINGRLLWHKEPAVTISNGGHLRHDI